MELVIAPGGELRCIYDELIDLAAIGPLSMSRASYVEPTADGRWTADLSPVGGPVLGPFSLRSQALGAEQSWLAANWLQPRG